MVVLDGAAVTVTLSGGGRLLEGSKKSVTVTVELDRALAAGEVAVVPVTVQSLTKSILSGPARLLERVRALSWSASGTGVTLGADRLSRSDLYKAALAVRFAGAGAQTAQITFTAVNGDADRFDERITVRIPSTGNALNAPARKTNLAGGLQLGSPSLAAVNLFEPGNELKASLTVSGGGTVAEGGSLTVTVTLDAITGTDVNIPVRMRTPGLPTASAADFTLSNSGVVTISSGTNQGTVTLTANTDGVAEPDEFLILEFGSLPVGIIAADSGVTAKVTITDPVYAALPEISIAAGTSSVTEGTAAEFTVSADTAPTSDLTVTVSVADVEGSDFVADGDEGDRTVTIKATETTATVSVDTTDDSIDEPDGDITATVEAGAGYRVSTTGDTAKVTVNDDDANNAPTVANPIPDQPATAGTAFSYTFPTGTFTDADSDALTYTATKPDDTALPSWLTFTAGSREFSGTPQSGDVGTVSVKVNATDSKGATVSDTFDIAVGPSDGVTLSTTALTLTELGSAADAVKSYTVVLDTDPGAGVTVTVTSGDPTAVVVDTDSVTAGDQSTLTFTHGNTGNWNTTQTVTLRAVNDGDAAAETVTVSHTATAADTDSPYHQIDIDGVSVTTVDAGHGAVVSKAAVTVAEDDDTDTYTIVLKSRPGGTVVITPSSNAAANAAVSGAVSFTDSNWNSPQTATVTGKGAGSATISHAVTTATTAYPTGTPIASVSATVSNVAPTVANPIPDQPATAGTAFTYTFPANTFADAGSLTYTATKSDDTALPGWLTFTPGTRAFSGTPQSGDVGTLSVKVTAEDDSGAMVFETFDITVSAAAPAAVTVAMAGSADGNAVEGANNSTGYRTVTISLGRALSGSESVTVPLSVAGATVTTDYTFGLHGTNTGVTLTTSGGTHTAQNPAVVFASGASSATLRLTPVDNMVRTQPYVVIDYGSGSRAPSGSGVTLGTVSGGPVGVVLVDDETGDFEVPSNWALAPSGLSGGDEFRLMFITSQTRTAVSTDIGVYNEWAQGVVAAGGHAGLLPYGGLVRVVGSTTGRAARVNTGMWSSGAHADGSTGDADSGVAVYWLAAPPASKIADNYFDFYDNSWDGGADQSSADTDESGAARTDTASFWTGSNNNGTASAANRLGASLPTTAVVSSGATLSGSVAGQSSKRSMLVMSPVFKVAAAAVPELTFGAATYSGGEGGGSIDVTVNADSAPSIDVTVNLSAANGTARGSGTDFTTPASTFTFRSGRTSETISISIVDDLILENHETFTLTLGAASDSSYTVGSQSSTVVTITDDDSVTVKLQHATQSVAEGDGTVVMRVLKDGDADIAVLGTLTMTDGTAIGGSDPTEAGIDYDDDPIPSFSIPAGVSSVDLAVPVNDDDEVEASETFTVALTAVGGQRGVSVGSPASTTVTITDNDVANNPPTVANPIPNQTATVGTSFGYTFATNTFTDADGDSLTYTAVKSDGAGLPGWLSFNASTRRFSGTPTSAGTVSVKVTAVDGNGGTVSDIFDIVVSAPAVPVVSFSSATYGGGEAAGSRSVSVTVNVDRAPTADLRVSFTVSGSATPGADYTALGSSVTIQRGATSAVVVVSITDDLVGDPSEEIVLTLTDGTAYDVGTTGVATVTISDDDTTGLVLSVTRLDIAEGRQKSFEVKLASQPTGIVQVDVSVPSGSGMSLSQSTGPNPRSQKLSFFFVRSEWDEGLTVVVNAHTDDDLVDASAVVSLEAFAGGYDAVTASLPVTVTDTEYRASWTDFAHLTVYKGDETKPIDVSESFGYAHFAVIRARTWTGEGQFPADFEQIPDPWGFKLCFGGTAVLHEDYQVRNRFNRPLRLDGNCSYPNVKADGTGMDTGQDRAHFYLNLYDDAHEDSGETIEVTLHDPQGTSLSRGGYDKLTYVIRNHDLLEPPEPQASIAADSDAVTEGAAARFAVQISPPPPTATTVTVRLAGADRFLAADQPRTVTVDVPATGVAAFEVPTVGDSARESDAQITATVIDGAGYQPDGDYPTAAVTVQDDDPNGTAPTVTVTADTTSITEGGTINYTITVTPAPVLPLEVTLTVTQHGSFGAKTGTRTVTIGAAGTAAVTVNTVDDTTHEADGAVTAAINDQYDYDRHPTAATATVTVTDDDIAPPQVSIADAAAAETDRYIGFDITLDKPATQPVTVSISLRDGTAKSGADYISLATTAHIPAGHTSVRHEVYIFGDDTPEPTETFTARIHRVTGPAQAHPTQNTATGTITETPPPHQDAQQDPDTDDTQPDQQDGDTDSDTGDPPDTGTDTDDAQQDTDDTDTDTGDPPDTDTDTDDAQQDEQDGGTDDSPPLECLLPADAVTVAEITQWRDALTDTAGIKRFDRVLATLGVDTGRTPMTAGQAQGVADWLKNTRWDRISRTLAALAQC